MEQMKKVSGDSRYHLAMEFCEWLFWNETEREDQLLVPNFKNQLINEQERDGEQTPSPCK